MSSPGFLKAYAQLVRLPNVFTAWADVLMGWFVVRATAGVTIPLPTLLLFLLASTCFYWAGMVLNDVFDAEEDRRDRPFRPIPSGRAPYPIAERLGYGLWLSGYISFAAAAGFGPNHWIGALLFVSIFAYNCWAKNTPLGPAVMGVCRFCNVLLPAAAFSELPLGLVLAATLIGVHVAGVTLFAKGEADGDERQRLNCMLFLYLGLMGISVAALALAVWFQRLPGAWFAFVGALSLLSLFVNLMQAAVHEPTPGRIQSAVRTALLGIIGLDAFLAAAFVGWPGLLILALLLPALFLGRYVYST